MTEGENTGPGARNDETDSTAVNAFNRGVIDEFRANAGRVGGKFEGFTLALLTTTGARTGIRRTTPLAYFELNGMPAVVASAMGGPRHPAWLANVRARPQVSVEVGAESFDALASIPSGIERDRLFAQVVEQDPEFGDYQASTSRVIPVVILQRLSSPSVPPFEGERARLVAWAAELRQVHDRLRQALRVAQDSAAQGRSPEVAGRELLLFCHGFCTALTGHHEGEDRELFPAIAAAHPELRDTLRYLQQDHSMIAHLVSGLQSSVDASATPVELARHLEGIAAIMESHFRYEERQLLEVLETLALDADPKRVLGPL